MTMREKIARAICDTAGYEWDEITAEAFLEQADAALAALREPDQHMLDRMAYEFMAGADQMRAGDAVKTVYQAAIDATHAENSRSG